MSVTFTVCVIIKVQVLVISHLSIFTFYIRCSLGLRHTNSYFELSVRWFRRKLPKICQKQIWDCKSLVVPIWTLSEIKSSREITSTWQRSHLNLWMGFVLLMWFWELKCVCQMASESTRTLLKKGSLPCKNFYFDSILGLAQVNFNGPWENGSTCYCYLTQACIT